jgi:hypothetical protein
LHAPVIKTAAAIAGPADGSGGRGERRREAMSDNITNDPSAADDNPFQPQRPPGKTPDEWLNDAAVYVRMSTEHQQYSTSNQMDVIREYAKKRGQEIVKEYSDDGKSGLNIKGRGALGQMIRDVIEGKAHYKSILVYDVSRWGRFQDADESAYYESLSSG